MSRLRDRRTRHDRFYRKAKAQRYAARSVYKLQELDRRFHLLRSGRRVLDLGCRPGSWMQYAAEKVGPRGVVLGVDRQELEIPLPGSCRVLVGDIRELTNAQLRAALPQGAGGCFHLVMSDMAPDTSGVAFTDQVRSVELFSRAMDLALRLGCPGGNFLGKIFMGEGFQETLVQLRRHFGKVKSVRPEATRKSSREVYLVGLGLIPGGKG